MYSERARANTLHETRFYAYYAGAGSLGAPQQLSPLGSQQMSIACRVLASHRVDVWNCYKPLWVALPLCAERGVFLSSFGGRRGRRVFVVSVVAAAAVLFRA